MSNLLASLSTSGNAMDVFQQALTVTQNNVDNASTPGYARQRLNLEAQPFDLARGLAGGVAARGLDNSRDEYLEEAVHQQTQALGQYTAQSQATDTIQSYFDVTGGGISAALDDLLQSFSAWSVTPNDSTARQTVLASASNLAASVNGLAKSLAGSSQQLDGQISATVDQINSIDGQIQQYNVQRLQEDQPDPGVDAQLHSALDDLSQLTNFSTVTQSDGTVTVLLAGGAPLVVGTQQYALSVDTSVSTQPAPVNPQSPPTSHILDWQGNDVTSQITGGQLGGSLDVRNRVLGSILGDGQQVGTNNILVAGTVSTDPGAANGLPLFTYDNTDATAAARTLAVNPAITPDQLAPVDSSGNVNGNALTLAALGSQAMIGGQTASQYLAQITAGVGQENQTATTNAQTQQQVVAQATTLRDQASGVSLDEEAVNVLQFQKAYQAAAQVLMVLNTLADTTINLVQPY